MVNLTIVRLKELKSLKNRGVPAVFELNQLQSDEGKELLASQCIFNLDELLSLRNRHFELSMQHEQMLLRRLAPRDTYRYADLAYALASGRIVKPQEATRMIAVDAALLLELAKRPEYLLIGRTANPPYCHVFGSGGIDYVQMGRIKACDAANFRLSGSTIERP